MALEPFQCSPLECEDQVDPGPLEYLRETSYATSSYDIHLSVSIQGQHMEKPATVCRSNYRYLYWNSRQQLVMQSQVVSFTLEISWDRVPLVGQTQHHWVVC
jgi:hypothetical protein